MTDGLPRVILAFGADNATRSGRLKDRLPVAAGMAEPGGHEATGMTRQRVTPA